MSGSGPTVFGLFDSEQKAWKACEELRGGTLTIRWDREGGGHIFMTGPAEEVFRGELEV